MNILISDTRKIDKNEVIELYSANGWSSANKPDELFLGLLNSHSLITARHDGRLVGLGNAISDGHLLVYYPHLLVHPDFHGQSKFDNEKDARNIRKLPYADAHRRRESIRFLQKGGLFASGSNRTNVDIRRK